MALLSWLNRRGRGGLSADTQKLLLFVPCAGIAQAAAPPQAADPAVIYVARRGWHIDVGFAAVDLQPPLKSLAAAFPGMRYLFLGFGDRRYFLAKDRNAAVLLSALWPGPGLLLVTALTAPPQDAFGAPHVASLALRLDQARGAQAFNTWAAEALKAAALPIRSAGVVFAGQLWSQVQRLEKKQLAAAEPRSGRRQYRALGSTGFTIARSTRKVSP